ncbi:PREDICTED: muscle M-line assembly protein unc-89-like [Nicrophorus vespilloides]|uniref:Muscle M-line assembly protein unc-89-like n=1 Tax=Nicrophorus vespilloides TaxID=110193 RepID=A0ABM1MK77_NICVS|nr:PREDICTED: muscle M-line assembly protein unc-89-like [Nicrophorus vespilloides]
MRFALASAACEIPFQLEATTSIHYFRARQSSNVKKFGATNKRRAATTTKLINVDCCIFAGYGWDRPQAVPEEPPPTPSTPSLEPPKFDMIIKEIDANLGETVLLPCTVRNLGDKVISWIRTRDLSILTSGTFTFSADSRFESVYSHEADFWGLRIRGVKITDTGQYECQVNTDPKMNLAVALTVADSRRPAGMSYKFTNVATIKSPREVYVRVGLPISLTCEIIPTSDSGSLAEKSRVRWMHKGQEITSESDRGGISVDTDYRERKITSRLRVSMVTADDEGFYTCTQEATRQDSVKLSVVQGKPLHYKQPCLQPTRIVVVLRITNK